MIFKLGKASQTGKQQCFAYLNSLKNRFQKEFWDTGIKELNDASP